MAVVAAYTSYYILSNLIMYLQCFGRVTCTGINECIFFYDF